MPMLVDATEVSVILIVLRLYFVFLTCKTIFLTFFYFLFSVAKALDLGKVVPVNPESQQPAQPETVQSPQNVEFRKLAKSEELAARRARGKRP